MVGGMLETVALIPVVSRFGRRPPSQSGFVLPLAITASAVLLLGSASIHTLSLQKRVRARAALQHEVGADQLRSAAQAFAAAAHGPESCLLRWAATDWPTAAGACVGSQPAELRQGQVGEMPWSLLDWQPFPMGGRLLLQLRDGRTGRFRLALNPAGSAVIGLGDLQRQARSLPLEMEP